MKLVLALFLVGFLAHAETLGPAERQALAEAQKILLNPDLLMTAAKENAGGEKAVSDLNALAGSPENRKQIMQLAADILGTITEKAQGDPNKMMALLEDLAKNPDGLEKFLTRAQREKLRVLGKSLEAKKMP